MVLDREFEVFSQNLVACIGEDVFNFLLGTAEYLPPEFIIFPLKAVERIWRERMGSVVKPSQVLFALYAIED